MNNSSLQLLNISNDLKLELGTLLTRFDSFRIGNDLSEIIEEDKTFSKEEVETKKKKKVSLIKRLFFTEYDA